MTYEYKDLETGEVFEVQQSMKDEPLQVRPCNCKRAPSGRERHSCGHRVQRLISAQRDPHLVSGDAGGWSSTGYAKPEAVRVAMPNVVGMRMDRATRTLQARGLRVNEECSGLLGCLAKSRWWMKDFGLLLLVPLRTIRAC